MKKYFFIAISALLLLACSGEKTAKPTFAPGEFKEWAQTPPPWVGTAGTATAPPSKNTK